MISCHGFDLPDIFEPWRLRRTQYFPVSGSKEMWIPADVQCQIQKFQELIAVVKNKPTSPCKGKRKSGKRKRKAPSPSPKCPVEYKVLSRVTVRIGKSLKSKIVGCICKGAIVTVNQIKGRRARVIHNTINGATIQIG